MKRGALIIAPALLGALGACSSGPKDFDNDNDALRREREALLAENASLRAELTETLAKLNEIARTRALVDAADPEALAHAMPRCAGLSYDRLTGPVDRDETPGVDTIDVYLKPFDGRQRFIQVSGWITVRADLLPEPDPASDEVGAPQTLGSVSLGPEQVREAYRSSVLGTHYALRIPFERPNRAIDGTIVLVTAFRDAQTGRRHRAQTSMTGTW